MNILGNPVGLDVPQTHSETHFLGFRSILPLSHSCISRTRTGFPLADVAFPGVALLPARDLEPTQPFTTKAEITATALNGTLLEA